MNTLYRSAALLCAALLLFPACAMGQGAVLQSGSVTPGHAVAWGANGIVVDGGALSGATPPGGSSGQIQYNNAGAFGGFTLGGDCTVTVLSGAIVCTKTNGTAFGAAATLGVGAGLTTSGGSIVLANPQAAILGGVKSYAAVSNQFLTSISTVGQPVSAQPAFSNLSGSITLAQFPSISTATVLGNVSGISAAPSALTQTQLTALLNPFTSFLSGAVPASGGGTTKFLRSDGTFSNALTGALSVSGDLSVDSIQALTSSTLTILGYQLPATVGGSVQIGAGSGGVGLNGGTLQLLAGNGGASGGGLGGNLTLAAGNSASGATGGSTAVYGGNGLTNGGAVSLYGGNGVTTGGSVNLTGGTGGTTSGEVLINSDPNLAFATYFFTGTPAATNQVFFLATRPLRVKSVSCIFSTAAGGASTLTVTKDSSTNAPAAGASVLSGTCNLNATGNTAQALALTGTAADLDMAAGDRLSVKFNNTIQSSAGVVVTVGMQPF